MRIEPNPKYHGLPCSYVATGCAYENYYGKPFLEAIPNWIRDDGYMTLEGENKFIRQFLPIKRKVYYKRSERFPLSRFLEGNTDKCCVCVYGHLVYVNGKDYWSFFDNENDPVVCVWYIQ